MKIICNKSQFASMVRMCYKTSLCYSCVLNEVCEGQSDLENMAEIIDDDCYEINTTIPS